MTATEHLEDLALRYARALVVYHSSGSDNDNYLTMLALHNTLNEVAAEVALENE